MSTFKDKFNAWLNQDVNNLPKTGFRSSGGATAIGDMRSKPQGEIADAIINIATNPGLEVVPIGVVFDIVELIKAYYVSPSIGDGALEAVWAIHHKLYSPNQTRIHHTLVVLDILYKNCGIIFVNTWSIYLHLFRNFFERKEVSQANIDLALKIVAGWQGIDIDTTFDLINKQAVDPIEKSNRFFDNLLRAKYPFTKESLDTIEEHRVLKLQNGKNIMPVKEFFKEGASIINDGRDTHFKTYKAGYHVA
ncbi:UNVERIFIED_CONTAM: hypothetical protein HDU68_004157 [Siphonaria sp. JEL0065]|nr:hypothetical protein HDU68_004157 [Siphonaria sp. JEL0065]